jgi:hypothetical protein
VQPTDHDPVSGVSYAFTRDGDNLIVDAWFEPHAKLPEHFHPVQEEHWSVVEGRAMIRNGDFEGVVAPEHGAQIVKAGSRHSVAACGEPARTRTLVLPALRLQEFLEESAAAGREGLFTSAGLPRGLRGARWAAGFLKRYRGETVMTFPPQVAQSAMIALLAR